LLSLTARFPYRVECRYFDAGSTIALPENPVAISRLSHSRRTQHARDRQKVTYGNIVDDSKNRNNCKN
jgi:hypothetical protein